MIGLTLSRPLINVNAKGNPYSCYYYVVPLSSNAYDKSADLRATLTLWQQLRSSDPHAAAVSADSTVSFNDLRDFARSINLPAGFGQASSFETIRERRRIGSTMALERSSLTDSVDEYLEQGRFRYLGNVPPNVLAEVLAVKISTATLSNQTKLLNLAREQRILFHSELVKVNGLREYIHATAHTAIASNLENLMSEQGVASMNESSISNLLKGHADLKLIVEFLLKYYDEHPKIIEPMSSGVFDELSSLLPLSPSLLESREIPDSRVWRLIWSIVNEETDISRIFNLQEALTWYQICLRDSIFFFQCQQPFEQMVKSFGKEAVNEKLKAILSNGSNDTKGLDMLLYHYIQSSNDSNGVLREVRSCFAKHTEERGILAAYCHLLSLKSVGERIILSRLQSPHQLKALVRFEANPNNMHKSLRADPNQHRKILQELIKNDADLPAKLDAAEALDPVTNPIKTRTNIYEALLVAVDQTALYYELLEEAIEGGGNLSNSVLAKNLLHLFEKSSPGYIKIDDTTGVLDELFRL